MAQFRRFYPMTVAEGSGISCGIRVNPEYSEVETELYNPCAPGTRFGMTADLLPDTKRNRRFPLSLSLRIFFFRAGTYFAASGREILPLVPAN